MDKLDNETWDEYAFKNNLFKIKYTDNDQQIIDDISIPNPNIITARTCDWGYYMSCVYGGYNTGFLEFIMHEIYTLRDKYKLAAYCVHIEFIENMTTERKEDINRQKWLFKELEFWERKWDRKHLESFKCKEVIDKKEIIQKEIDKNRYLELKTIISETHKEQLDELIALFSFNVQYTLIREKRQIEKKERIKLYQNFMKNKKIHSEISILEEKINQLKEELVL